MTANAIAAEFIQVFSPTRIITEDDELELYVKDQKTFDEELKIFDTLDAATRIIAVRSFMNSVYCYKIDKAKYERLTRYHRRHTQTARPTKSPLDYFLQNLFKSRARKLLYSI